VARRVTKSSPDRVVNRELDLAPIIAERVDALRSATEHYISIDIRRLPRALGDPNALATVLDQLLDNAVKHSPIDEPIELRVVTREKSVELEIVDRGIGMDGEHVEQCFDRFRPLVEAMGGRLRVGSAPGRGSTFTVILQRARPQRRAGGSAITASR
jgi:signal transduction histidine kinase